MWLTYRSDMSFWTHLDFVLAVAKPATEQILSSYDTDTPTVNHH